MEHDYQRVLNLVGTKPAGLGKQHRNLDVWGTLASILKVQAAVEQDLTNIQQEEADLQTAMFQLDENIKALKNNLQTIATAQFNAMKEINDERNARLDLERRMLPWKVDPPKQAAKRPM